MRTTVTLEPDVEELLQTAMRERRINFKEAVNSAIRAGLAPKGRKPFVQKTYKMGPPKVDLTKALQLAGELEDQEIIRKMRLNEQQ